MTLPRPVTAILLAAGLGSRIAPLAAGTPKPLLRIDDASDAPTFLDFHAARLAEAGVTDLILVGNVSTFGTPVRAAEGLSVRWVRNPTEDLRDSGSGHSLQLALAACAEATLVGKRLLVMDADIVYSATLLPRVLRRAPGASFVVVQADALDTGEEVHVFADPARPSRALRQGKGLTGTPMTEALSLVGEATGLIVIEAEDVRDLRAAAAWTLTRSTARQRSEHEDIVNQLMGMGRVEIAYVDPDEVFTECDTAEDYARMVGEVIPTIRAELSRMGRTL